MERASASPGVRPRAWLFQTEQRKDDVAVSELRLANIDVARLRAHHLLMHRIRALEEVALRALAEKQVLGAIHPSIGQEAVAAGVIAHLTRRDLLLSTHRGHGHTLAKGASSTAMFHELLGRQGGTCG